MTHPDTPRSADYEREEPCNCKGAPENEAGCWFAPLIRFARAVPAIGDPIRGDWMSMNSGPAHYGKNGQQLFFYKHYWTRGYLILDAAGHTYSGGYRVSGEPGDYESEYLGYDLIPLDQALAYTGLADAQFDGSIGADSGSDR